MTRSFVRVRAASAIVAACLFVTSAAPAMGAPIVAQPDVSPANARCDTSLHRIRFSRGSYGVTVNGSLSSVCPSKWYVLRALRGQHMRVQIIGYGPTAGVVYFPGGGQDGGPGGVVYDGTLPRTGDYRIKVMESTMANRWNGGFSLVVTVY